MLRSTLLAPATRSIRPLPSLPKGRPRNPWDTRSTTHVCPHELDSPKRHSLILASAPRMNIHTTEKQGSGIMLSRLTSTIHSSFVQYQMSSWRMHSQSLLAYRYFGEHVPDQSLLASPLAKWRKRGHGMFDAGVQAFSSARRGPRLRNPIEPPRRCYIQSSAVQANSLCGCTSPGGSRSGVFPH